MSKSSQGSNQFLDKVISLSYILFLVLLGSHLLCISIPKEQKKGNMHQPVVSRISSKANEKKIKYELILFSSKYMILVYCCN